MPRVAVEGAHPPRATIVSARLAPEILARGHAPKSSRGETVHETERLVARNCGHAVLSRRQIDIEEPTVLALRDENLDVQVSRAIEFLEEKALVPRCLVVAVLRIAAVVVRDGGSFRLWGSCAGEKKWADERA